MPPPDRTASEPPRRRHQIGLRASHRTRHPQDHERAAELDAEKIHSRNSVHATGHVTIRQTTSAHAQAVHIAHNHEQATAHASQNREQAAAHAASRATSKLPRTPSRATSKLPHTPRRTTIEPLGKSPSDQSDLMHEPSDELDIEPNPLDYSL